MKSYGLVVEKYFDEQYVGSQNISTQSLDKNREVGIIVADTSVLNTLQQTFASDWSQSRSV